MSEPNPSADLIDRPCPFVTFYSFKGGVGRSMAVINVAGIMASRGFRVLVVDMDLEAPGLSFLANPTPSEEGPRLLQPGFVDVMLDAVEREGDGDLFQLSAEDVVRRYSTLYELPDGSRRSPEGSLHIMPAGRIDDDYSGRLTRLDLPSLYQEGVGLALIQAFKQVVQDSKLFDYVFIDSRTGFSDESGICTRDLADCLMVVSGLNKQNVEGTTHFLSALRRATDERKPLEVILSPIPNGEDALVDEREKDARAAFTTAWGAPVRTELHIPYHPQLALTEEPHIFRRRRGYLFDAYNKIEQSVLSLLGDTGTAILELAKAALKTKEYSVAEAHLRRVSKLTDRREWAGLNVLLPNPEWVADPDAESVFRFIIGGASTTERESLGRWIGYEASHRSKSNLDLAEILYERVLEAAPDDADNLGNYATFLRHERRDFDAAEAMYQRALDADPKHANNLGNYANFLVRDRRDFDAAEAMYKRALDAAPKHATSLGNYAHFLARVRRDFDAAEAMFKRALDAAPKHANNLGNYALFLRRERKDLDAAEAMYRRALAADPKHASSLGNYANFLVRDRRDFDAAEAMFKRALDANPNDANNLGNYARLCLTAGRMNEGLELVDRALAIRAGTRSLEAIDAELWMYVFCCGESDRQRGALQQLRTLVQAHSVSTEDWGFAGVIEQARTMAHPDQAWLPTLADVLAGRRPPAALDDWPAWHAAVTQ